jgi:trehalose 6-phosphate synthase/phosphatase
LAKLVLELKKLPMMTRTLTETFSKAGTKLLLLDYDGTLVNFSTMPKDAVPSEKIMKLIKNLAARPNMEIVIITGRDSQQIEGFLGHLPVNIIAEHGAMIKKKNVWQNHLENDCQWKNALFPVLVEYTLNCPGSFVEEKKFSLCWHYRKSKEKSGREYSRDLIDEVDWYLKKYNLKVLDGKKVVEILPANTDKGKAALMLLNEKSYDCVISIGDDQTDEDIFKALLPLENCHTIKVGEGFTYAKHRFESVADVIHFLEEI